MEISYFASNELLSEATMRTATCILKDKLRKVEGVHVHETVLEYFNLLLGNDEKSINYWKNELSNKISEKFPTTNPKILLNLRKCVLVSKVFDGVSEKLGLT